MMIPFLLLCLLTPVICLPASCSQDIVPRPYCIPLLQQMCARTIQRTLLYDTASESADRYYEELKNNNNAYTMPIIVSALNEAIINSIGWQPPVEFPLGRSGFAALCAASPRDADNLYDAAGNRIQYMIEREGTITKLLDNKTKSVLHAFEDLPVTRYGFSGLNSIAYSTCGTLIALLLKTCIQIRRRADNSLLKNIDLPDRKCLIHIEFSRDNTKIIVSNFGLDAIHFLDAKSGVCIRTLHVGGCSKLSPDGTLRACLSASGGLKVIDEETGIVIQEYPAPSKYRKNRFLLNWSADGTFLLWSTPCGYSSEVKCWNRHAKSHCHYEQFEQFLEIAEFTDMGDLIYFEEENTACENPQWFICPSYIHSLEHLVIDKTYIPFLLTALQRSWRYSTPHPILPGERTLYLGLCDLMPFMKNKKLYRFPPHQFLNAMNKKNYLL